MDFWKENGGMLAPKINEKKDISFEKRFCWICTFSLGENHFFHNSGGRSWKKNRSKIDEKIKSRWEGILASMFNGFWWIFGGKLGGKMEPRSIQEGIEKTIKKKHAVFNRFWWIWEAKLGR